VCRVFDCMCMGDHGMLFHADIISNKDLCYYNITGSVYGDCKLFEFELFPYIALYSSCTLHISFPQVAYMPLLSPFINPNDISFPSQV